MHSPNKAKYHSSRSIIFHVYLDKKWTHRTFVWTHQGFLLSKGVAEAKVAVVFWGKRERCHCENSELRSKTLLTAEKKPLLDFWFLVTGHMCRSQITVPWCKPKIAQSMWLPYVVSGFQKPSQIREITRYQSPLNYSTTLKCSL